jgi:hypothetical protein
MSKRNGIIIILIVILIIIGALLFWYFNNGNKPVVNNTVVQQQTLPFGNTSDNKNPTPTEPNQTGQTDTSTTKSIGKLTQIYKTPTSGSVFFTRKNTQIIRFTDRANGNSYEFIPETNPNDATRITNTTIPKIQESIWSNNGSSLVLRYLDDKTDGIVSFAGKINVSTTTAGISGQMIGSFLPANIKQLVINPSGNKIFSFSNNQNKNGSIGIFSSLDGSNKIQSFSSPLADLNVFWPTDNIITFTTKPTYGKVGYLFFYNIQEDSFTKIMGDVSGMITLTNGDASLVAYSFTQNNLSNLNVYDVKNNIRKLVQFYDLADKCVWGQNNKTMLYCAAPKNIQQANYPDVWYQGLLSFSDNFWQINTDTGETKLIYETNNTNENIDGFNMVISADDKYVVFQNKNDLSLWLLNLSM